MSAMPSMNTGWSLGVGQRAIFSAPTYRGESSALTHKLRKKYIDAKNAYLLSDLVRVLNVQLVQCLNVLVNEGDGDQHEVLLSAFHQS